MPKILCKRQLRQKIVNNTILALNDLQQENSSLFVQSFSHSSDLAISNDSCLETSQFSAGLESAQTEDASNLNSNAPLEPLISKSPSSNYPHDVSQLLLNLTKNNQDEDDNSEFLNRFKLWILGNPSVTHRCVNELVQLIKPKYPFLSKDCRTILGTPKKVDTIRLENGEMVYFGLINNLKSTLAREKLQNIHSLSLQFNIDGLPLYNSSAIEFWPILVRLVGFNVRTPFVAAIFCGEGKPKPLSEYLKIFIEDLSLLLQKGIYINNHHLDVTIGAFCCDAPARSYLKEVMSHNSRFGCERCVIRSLYSADEKRRFYPTNVEENKRSGVDFFENISNDGHIKGKSPLLKLGIDLVTTFILDPMHLIYLGVVKRLLINYWINGKRPFKISKLAVSNINHLLNNIRRYIPTEFGRKIRTLKDVKRWKAVEFRFFLLYCGIVVLKNIIKNENYRHFLQLHTAIFILNNQSFIDMYIDNAKKNLIEFVKKSPKVYDKFFVVYNVHSLIHICEDVVLNGPLENFSCFGYESYLGRIKRTVRGKSLPLQQINNRIMEISKIFNNLPSKPVDDLRPYGVERKGNGDFFYCKKLCTSKFTLSINRPDNFVAVGCNIYVIKSIYFFNGTYRCTGTRFKYVNDYYTYPMQSSKLGIYYVKSVSTPDTFLLSDITFKYVSLPYKDGFVVVPIVHQI